MQNFFTVKAPIQFLILEGDVHSSLSFIGPELVLFESFYTDTVSLPFYVFEHIAETFKVSTEIKEINTRLSFPLPLVFETNSTINIKEYVSDYIFTYFTHNFFIIKEKEWIAYKFNSFFESAYVLKEDYKIPTDRDFYKYLKEIDDKKYNSINKITDNFVWKNFW